MSKRDKGFSLIELLIVVAIILIIAAIAIPNLLRSRMAANEASAVGSIRTINTAEVTYESTYDDGYANALPLLGGAAGVAATCNNAEIVDPVLSANNPVDQERIQLPTGPRNGCDCRSSRRLRQPGLRGRLYNRRVARQRGHHRTAQLLLRRLWRHSIRSHRSSAGSSSPDMRCRYERARQLAPRQAIRVFNGKASSAFPFFFLLRNRTSVPFRRIWPNRCPPQSFKPRHPCLHVA